MTTAERMMVDVMALLCLEWHFPDERDTLHALMRDAMARVRPRPGMAALIDAANVMLSARGHVATCNARVVACRALATVLKADVVARVRAA